MCMKFFWNLNASVRRSLSPLFQQTLFLLPLLFRRYLSPKVSRSTVLITTLVPKISLKDKSLHISINSWGIYLYLQNACCFLSNVYFLPCVGNIFKFITFTFLENALYQGIFIHAPLPTQNLHLSSYYHTLGRVKTTHSPRERLFIYLFIFWKSVSRK